MFLIISLHYLVGRYKLIRRLLYIVSDKNKVTTTVPSNPNGMSWFWAKVKLEFAILLKDT